MATRRKSPDQQFIDYVLSFYGKGGIYPFRPVMRHGEAMYALGIWHSAAAAGEIVGIPKGTLEVEIDTFDRELVRDIVLLTREPTAEGQVSPEAYRMFKKYAHKRWQSRTPRLKVVGSRR